MKHTARCDANRGSWAEMRAEYVAKWPKSCRKCDASGGMEVSDRVPYGSTWVSMPSTEPCPECMEQGKCPRCGFTGMSEDWETPTPCAQCGWQWGDKPGDRCPPEWDCDCWEFELDTLAEGVQ